MDLRTLFIESNLLDLTTLLSGGEAYLLGSLVAKLAAESNLVTESNVVAEMRVTRGVNASMAGGATLEATLHHIIDLPDLPLP